MFKFIFKYNLKMAFGNRTAIFWLIIFPFALSTIFSIVFSKIDTTNNFEKMPIMVQSDMYRSILETIETDNKKLFEIKEYKNPDKALENKEIIGYVKQKSNGFKMESEVVIDKPSLNTAILYNTVNNINKLGLTISEIAKDTKNYSAIPKIIKDISNQNSVEIKKAFTMKNKKSSTIFFYALLSMICLGATAYGIIIIESMNVHSTELSTRRLICAPISRLNYLIPQFFAYTLITSISSMVLYSYMRYILKVDFGGNQFQIIFGLIIGNVMSIIIGMLISVLINQSLEIKQSINAVFYVFSCSLAGMMDSRVMGFFTNKMPAINYINPGTVLSRMFTSIYISENNVLYFKSIINILVIIIVTLVLTLLLVRRRLNDSI
ncbi:ABC transporter permease [Peptostreptococcus canis]|uniref:ABC transporter permease n=1 Tax=Peptostreptococcus canis TaxID=1159213 RepID=A0ABR6TLE9_9FIRM|nr:ABC transporter permease [Peptostreptococcus canis]MBC2576229.1 ABC transporter permease [Peptostreptococcus canis]MBP1998236.1 ABC-type multidrug transport system permease subunit [Peptostreptococcus canis]